MNPFIRNFFKKSLPNFYNLIRLGWSWINKREWGNRVYMNEKLSLHLNWITKVIKEGNFDSFYVEKTGDVFVKTADDIKVLYNTSYDYPLGTGQALEFNFEKNCFFEETFIFPYLGSKKSIYVDVGANNGYYYTLKVARKFSNIHVLAIEPNKKVRFLLKKNIELNDCKNVTVQEYALSSRNSFSYLNESLGASGFLISSDTQSGLARVETIRADDLLKNYPDEQVSFIKVDIEGHELDFLKGSTDILNKDTPFLLLEFDEALLRNNGKCDPKDMINLLKSHRYAIRKIKNSRDIFAYHQSKETLVTAEVLSNTLKFEI